MPPLGVRDDRARGLDEPGAAELVERGEPVPGLAVLVDVEDVRAWRAGGDRQVRVRVTAPPPARSGPGRWSRRGSRAGWRVPCCRAGRGRPASRGRRRRAPGPVMLLVMAVPPSSRARGRGRLAWPQRRVSAGELVGGGGEQPGVPFGLPGQGAGGAPGLEVQDGPQLGQPVQDVQAQRVLVPAVGQAGGEVAVAGPVDLVDPGAQLGDRLVARGAVELPEPGRRGRLVARRARRRRRGDVGEPGGQRR